MLSTTPRPAGILFLTSTVLVEQLERLLPPFLSSSSCLLQPSPAERMDRSSSELVNRPLSFLTALHFTQCLFNVVSGWILEVLLAVKPMELTSQESSLAAYLFQGPGQCPSNFVAVILYFFFLKKGTPTL